MRQAISKTEQTVLERLTYLTGSPETVAGMNALPVRSPFDEETLEFWNDVSKAILSDRAAYPEEVTFAFWVRKAATQGLKTRFVQDLSLIHI